jgi:alpha-galactosidase
MPRVYVSIAMLVVLSTAVSASSLGDKPAMSWRNWNFFRGNITQEIMQAQMKALVARERPVWGIKGLASLSDVGYTRTGLDDNWQDCGAGFQGAFHDADGNPLVNHSRFPDMKGMVDYGHSLGLTVGWYINNW